MARQPNRAWSLVLYHQLCSWDKWICLVATRDIWRSLIEVDVDVGIQTRMLKHTQVLLVEYSWHTRHATLTCVNAYMFTSSIPHNHPNQPSKCTHQDPTDNLQKHPSPQSLNPLMSAQPSKLIIMLYPSQDKPPNYTNSTIQQGNFLPHLKTSMMNSRYLNHAINHVQAMPKLNPRLATPY